jgi:ankyrin repeat protein
MMQRARVAMEAVEFLVASGADVQAGDDSGATALHYATQSGNKALTAWLIDKGANVNAAIEKAWPEFEMPKPEDFIGATPLHCAAAYADSWRDGQEQIVELLLARGVNARSVTANGRTALHFAPYYFNQKVTELLLAHGLDVNARDKNGTTPLHIAVTVSIKAVEFLVSHGADVNARDNDGKTPVDVARSNKWKDDVMTQLHELLEQKQHGKTIPDDGSAAGMP